MVLHVRGRYVGEMGRDMATSRLERRVDGTFLLRVRPHPTHHADTDTHYALSLKSVLALHATLHATASHAIRNTAFSHALIHTHTIIYTTS
jgi:hypothetical protein